jgi:hypothetical protein
MLQENIWKSQGSLGEFPCPLASQWGRAIVVVLNNVLGSYPNPIYSAPYAMLTFPLLFYSYIQPALLLLTKSYAQKIVVIGPCYEIRRSTSGII